MSPGTNIFLLASLAIAGIAVLAAGLTFGYERYLLYVEGSKEAELARAEAAVDQDTVTGFVRLRDRFTAGKNLLDNHVVLSQLFDVLETVTLQNVRFQNLNVTVTDDRSATLRVSGIARNFNTLAVQSNTIAADPRFKRAIFSGITVNQDNTVSFQLSADIDPRLVVIGPAAAGTAVPPPAAPAVEEQPQATTTAPAATTTTTRP